MSDAKSVAISLGASNWDLSTSSVDFQKEIVPVLRAHGVGRLDTSRIYGQGASESAIGILNLAADFIITTKAPGLIPGSGGGDAILAAAKESFKSLGVEKVHIYLLHGPDDSVDVAETYSAVQVLYVEGRFDKFGLSNFTPAQVRTFYNYGKTNNFVVPTVYQSTYSAALRLNETLLFPTLRELGMSIQAYSPLASGFLAKSAAAFRDSSASAPEAVTPQTTSENKSLGARWDPNTFVGRLMRILFEKPEYLTMLQQWENLAQECGVSQAGLAYRWVRYHSFLDGEKGDEMIVGASSVKQFEDAMREIEQGPLDAWVVAKIEAMWEGVKDVAEVDNLRAFKLVMGSMA
ncbi:hypothetical protein VTL71DRAFT_6901 [Oculimacula yallundae]|uniref:NADP-dependent oxidoreductase domain-containing protein n=1 Tax=Oculimacula yallundae TaxID=86028 RepID=A0ABR4BV65_9HELO